MCFDNSYHSSRDRSGRALGVYARGAVCEGKGGRARGLLSNSFHVPFEIALFTDTFPATRELFIIVGASLIRRRRPKAGSYIEINFG